MHLHKEASSLMWGLSAESATLSLDRPGDESMVLAWVTKVSRKIQRRHCAVSCLLQSSSCLFPCGLQASCDNHGHNRKVSLLVAPL